MSTEVTLSQKEKDRPCVFFRITRARSIELVLMLLVVFGVGATIVPFYTHNDTYSVPSTRFFEKKTQPLTFLVVGDIMLGRHVGELMRTNGNTFPFVRIADVLASVDFVFGNLEGPVTLLHTEPDNTMRFQFDPSVAEALHTHNIRLVSLANNHWGDQGTLGHEHTRVFLNAAGVAHVGGQTKNLLGTVATVPEKNVVFLGLDTTITAHNREQLRAELLAFPDDVFLVVCVHWGDEYQTTHNEAQESFAYFLIDNGVDAVFGTHPHVVQESATYKGKPIYYSLGNFIFDQYWNEAVQTGLVVKVTIGDTVVFEPIHIRSDNSQPFVAVDGVDSSGTMDSAKP